MAPGRGVFKSFGAILAPPMPDAFHALEETVTRDVTRALAEDIGTGDLTAALIPAASDPTTSRRSRAVFMVALARPTCA